LIQKFVVLLLRLTFLPITRDDDNLLAIGRNCRSLLPPSTTFGAMDFRHIAASWSRFDKISFLSFSAFNSLRNCALVFFPIGHKTRCCIKDIADGLISALENKIIPSTSCSNRDCSVASLDFRCKISAIAFLHLWIVDRSDMAEITNFVCDFLVDVFIIVKTVVRGVIVDGAQFLFLGDENVARLDVHVHKLHAVYIPQSFSHMQ
ncbi:hypothetical protein ALC60_05702, partial [Trachymyrmex zeteki]